ncbi:hypothetical protein CEXT_560571 [Caerostris extrusa]|uniref:Uncharacterized protein n=1 Tax=Caerostris extrusa TaxID=172846 RepID=A0AAV4MD51_CAEEX|nr:hypothetical protein CEXT_560571 [Caerostris extrusa]
MPYYYFPRTHTHTHEAHTLPLAASFFINTVAESGKNGNFHYKSSVKCGRQYAKHAGEPGRMVTGTGHIAFCFGSTAKLGEEFVKLFGPSMFGRPSYPLCYENICVVVHSFCLRGPLLK